MAAEKNLPVTHVFAKSTQLDRADQLSRFKRGPNIVWRHFRETSDQQRASPNESVLSSLFSKSFIGRLRRLGRSLFELIVARPKRELIDQVLRFNDVTGRMTRAFFPFVLQIKGNLGGTMPFIGN